jgi:lambda family phage tail tape measure protein
MANMIARLGVNLGLDTAEFNRGIEAAGKKLEQFSQSAEKFGKMGATALVAASAAALQYADELADVAKANDVAIGTVLKLSNALANAGGKANDSGKLLASFTKFIDEAAGGSFEAQKTAKMLGVSLQDLGKMSEEQLLNKVVKNLGAMDDSVTRNAKAMEVFGKAAKGVDFISLADDMSKSNKLNDEQAKGIQAAADSYDILAQSARDTMLVIGTELGPVLKTTLEYIKSMQGDTNILGQVVKVVFQTVAVLGSEIHFFFKAIFDEIAHTYNNAVILVTKGVDAAIAANQRYNASVNNNRQNVDFFQAQIMGETFGRASNDPRRTDFKAPSTGGGRNVIEARNKDAEAAERKRLRELEHQFKQAQIVAKIQEDAEKKQIEAFAHQSKRLQKQEQELEVAKELSRIENTMQENNAEDVKLAKDLYLAEHKRLENIREINLNTELDGLQKLDLIERENALADATARYAQEQYKVTKQQREGTFEQGFGKSMRKFIRDMPTEMETGAKAFDSMIGNMGSAIDNFVRTGKLNFKDLARSIIQDIIAIQMKAMATKFLGSLFGGDMSQPAAVMGMPGYADGGNPAVGQVSVVGERGPELFVPRTAGTIIPNHALAGVGGTTNVTNNYINAIDTKSFEERLLGSSTAIWAANKYGEKNLATNYGRT